MPLIHIVLVKVKPSVKSDPAAWSDFVSKCQTLGSLPGPSKYLIEAAWGEPLIDARAHGWNYGLYSKLKDEKDLELYRDDADHQDFIKDVLRPNIDDILAYDFMM